MESTSSVHPEGGGDRAAAVAGHYGRQDLGRRILAALRAAGKDPDHPTADDLSPATEYHIGGKQATLKLASLAGLREGMRVLDVGGGPGGAARTLASELGCRVTVLDLTEEFCRVGQWLTELTGLSERVTFQHGNALAMPFADASFDAVLTQHSSMNIADKARLYAEIRRVLRPGGRLGLHEIVAGSNQPVYFPVPWALEPSISSLLTAEATQALLAESGFREVVWQDLSRSSLEFFRQRIAAAAAAGPPPLGPHLMLGDDFGPTFRNQIRNLEEGRIAVVMAVFDRR